jgi:hypothetical protein
MTDVVEMKRYGAVLTGREFGKDVAKALIESIQSPVTLDFRGVLSLGSSFGEEVIPAIASRQGQKIRVANTNGPVRMSLRDIAEKSNIHLEFV